MTIADFKALSRFFGFAGKHLGAALTAFEVMWPEYYQLIAVDSGRHRAPLLAGSAYYVVIEANGNDAERDEARFVEILGQAVEDELVSDAVIASSRTQSQAIWSIREDVEGLFAALSPLVGFDVSLPIHEMEGYVAQLRESLRQCWGDEAKLIIFGHLGDGNLHVLVAPRPWNDSAHKQAEKIVYEPLKTIGGSISAEHGIGMDKRDWLHLSRSAEELALMSRLKEALDPKAILNPGRIFPTGNPGGG